MENVNFGQGRDPKKVERDYEAVVNLARRMSPIAITIVLVAYAFGMLSV